MTSVGETDRTGFSGADPGPKAKAGLQRREHFATALLILPVLVVTIVFFVLPLSMMMVESFKKDGAFSLAQYHEFFTSPIYYWVILTTFTLSLITTVGTLIIGYPVAYYLATTRSRLRNVLLLLVVIPYWLDYIVRSYSWMILLGRNGIISRALQDAKLTDGPVTLLYNTFSVSVGMIQIMLPLMILTLYAAMLRIDQELVLAARVHGAGVWRSFAKVFLPLSLPGIYAAALLVFIISLGFYVTPALLGGPGQAMISQSIDVIASRLLDFPLASAAAMVLLAISLLVVIVYNRTFGWDRAWTSPGI